MERATGFEPATSTLARLHSTTELRPRSEKRFYENPQELVKERLGRYRWNTSPTKRKK